MKKIKTVLIVICLLAVTAPALAEEAVSLYVENDSRLLKPVSNTDRHYTHGTKFVYLFQPDWQWLDGFAAWNAARPGETVDTVVGLFFGQNIYTPDHVDVPARRQPEDRVFAGWLYGGLFAQRATDDLLEHIELNLGVIGPASQADQVQRCIHEFLDSNPPKGWDDQIGDEPAADVTWLRQQRLTDGPLAPTPHTDVLAEYGFTAGSVHRHAQAGLMARYGFNLAKTFGPGRLEFPTGVSTFRKTGDLEDRTGYLFARAGLKAVEHDRFLTGLSTEPFVGELQLGAVYKQRNFELGWSQTFFTQQYKQQTANDSIGALSLTWHF